MSIDEFYARVNHQLSLIINKLKTESYSEETITVLIETYRNRTLEVFVRGLNGELSSMIMLMKPKTLPEAYSQCLELRNISYRSQVTLHSSDNRNKIQTPISYNKFPSFPIKTQNQTSQRFVPRNRYQPQVNPYVNRRFEPQRATQQSAPDKPEPMDVDRSTQFRRFGNRQWNNNNKRHAFSEQVRSMSVQRPFKHQRLFNMAQEEGPNKEEDVAEDEINFQAQAFRAYHT